MKKLWTQRPTNGPERSRERTSRRCQHAKLRGSGKPAKSTWRLRWEPIDSLPRWPPSKKDHVDAMLRRVRSELVAEMTYALAAAPALVDAQEGNDGRSGAARTLIPAAVSFVEGSMGSSLGRTTEPADIPREVTVGVQEAAPPYLAAAQPLEGGRRRGLVHRLCREGRPNHRWRRRTLRAVCLRRGCLRIVSTSGSGRCRELCGGV